MTKPMRCNASAGRKPAAGSSPGPTGGSQRSSVSITGTSHGLSNEGSTHAEVNGALTQYGFEASGSREIDELASVPQYPLHSRQALPTEEIMSDRATDFTGSIPAFYDRGLGPVFFNDFAHGIARRAAAS